MKLNGASDFFGTAYDLGSIKKFYELNENSVSVRRIKNINVDYLESIAINGKPVSKEYIKSLRMTEVHFSMQKQNGIWVVDLYSCNSDGDMFATDQGFSNVPNGHIHPNFYHLEGAMITTRHYSNGTLIERSFGPLASNRITPSENDMNIAGRQNKINAINGTLRNIIASGNGFSFYNADTLFIAQ